MEDVFPLKAFRDGALPAIEYVFGFRHGQSHEFLSGTLQVLWLVEGKRHFFSAGALFIGFCHQPEDGDEIGVYHIPVGIDAARFQPRKQSVIPPHHAATASDLPFGDAIRPEIVAFAGKSHVSGAVEHLPYGQGRYIEVAFFAQKDAVYIENDFFHNCFLHGNRMGYRFHLFYHIWEMGRRVRGSGVQG